jgi:hypothetical protein
VGPGLLLWCGLTPLRFAAVGEVRAIRGRSRAALEFVRMNAGGNDSLTAMVADPPRLQAIMNKRKAVRHEMEEEAFRQELEQGVLQSSSEQGGPCPQAKRRGQTAISTTPPATSSAAIQRRRPTRSCRKMRAATALATKVSEADAGTTRLRFPQESPKSRL